MPREQVEIRLTYEGPDVDDGTMSLQDIVPVLQGFSSAYGKLASRHDPGTTHRIKINSVSPGSAVIGLEVWTVATQVPSLIGDAWKMLGENVAPITSTSILVGGAYWVFSQIAGVSSLKRHTQRKPHKESVKSDNRISVTNSNNVTIDVSLDVYNLFVSGELDADLDKLTSPLVPGRIDSAELEARPADGLVIRERITAEERPYFRTDAAPVVTSSKPAWFIAKLNSLVKSTNAGWLYLSDGTRAYYRYLGNDKQGLYSLFGSYDGPVRIWASANLDENFKPVSVDVFEIEPAQGNLFSDLPKGDDGE